MTNKANRTVLSKRKGKKVSKPPQKPRNTEVVKSTQKEYLGFLLVETLKLKEQKLKDLIELEVIYNKLKRLLAKNPHLKLRANHA